MTDNTFNELWATLLAAYPREAQRVSGATQRLYHHDLADLPDELFCKGVENARKTCVFFPSIAEIGGAALGCAPQNWQSELANWREREATKLANRHKKIEYRPALEEQKRVKESLAQLGEKFKFPIKS